MSKAGLSAAGAIIVSIGMGVSAWATLIPIGISPEAGLALNSVNYAAGDHAVGLSDLNTEALPGSGATGGVIGNGIWLDDVTNELSFEFAYGSDFGFVDLGGDFSISHIHGPVAVQFPATNTGVGVVVGLDSFHTAGSSARTGSYAGAVTLTDQQETDLLANLYYVNIHSGLAGGGEIRGQLVAMIPEPATAGLALLGFVVLLRGRRRGRRA
jgi:hypothetical protein